MPPKIARETLQKLQPKLRMIADGDAVVNTVRAERSAAIAVESPVALKRVKQCRTPDSVPVALTDLKKKPRRPPHLKSVTGAVRANVFLHLRDEHVKTPATSRPHCRKGQLLQVQAPLNEIPAIASAKGVTYVEIAEALKMPVVTTADGDPDPPAATERRFGSATQHKFGEEVLIGIIDVQGFDFSHRDFLDENGKTRFVRIWDQGGDARPSPHDRDPAFDRQFEYGAEFQAADINLALTSAAGLGLPATDIERQSQRAEGSHGTHVASIAAGNRGVCRRAKIAGVLISLPEEDEDKRLSFYDSSRLADAVDYLLQVAHEEGDIPVSINVSLGTNGHSHDGSAAVTRWIDSALAKPGRAVTVAAGNSGQEKGETDDDIGWIMGRIHSSGTFPAAGLEQDLEWVVVGNGIMDLSENELEIWYSAQDRLAVSIKPPGMDWIGPIEPREFIQNRMLDDGTMFSAYNEVFHPANGLNYISVYLSPFFQPPQVIGVTAGTWIVRLHSREVRDGRYHAWIERDDPQRLGRVGTREAWSFPSFFTERTLVDDTTVSSLGCGSRVITVANLDSVRNQISISSSQGPTRDGREKPDIAAPGTGIVAAKGFAGEDNAWLALSGTSMASPLVTGVVGLMLAMKPQLTAAQIESIIRRTARPLPGSSFSWSNAAGFGVIDPDACLTETARLDARKDLGLMHLTAFQSDKGDCLLLTNTDGTTNILVDGGMSNSYNAHVAAAMGKLRTARKNLDVVYVSHVDQDHIAGVLKMLDDEAAWRVHVFQKEHHNPNSKPPTVPRPPKVLEIWHNGFHDQVPKNGQPIADALSAAAPVLAGSKLEEIRAEALRQSDLITSIGEAIEVSRRISSKQLNIPLNPRSGGKLMMLRQNQQPIQIGGLTITIIGPTSGHLKTLREEWNTWLESVDGKKRLLKINAAAIRDEERMGTSEFDGLMASLLLQAESFGDPDEVTTPNLASLTLLVEDATASLLLTGDARGDQIVDGLEAAGRLTAGKIEVDVLKVPHHGSENNIDSDFVEAVIARDYVFCGNGSSGNPNTKVIEMMCHRRLAASPKPFKFWFNSSKAVSAIPGHMAAVETLVKQLKATSHGRFTFKFLTTGSKIKIL